MNKWLVFGVLSFFLVLGVDVYTDLHGEVDHRRGAILRAIGLVFPLAFFTKAKGTDLPRVLWIGLISLLMICFNYFNLFDGFYNVFRGHGWFFTGSEDGPGDAMTDNFLQALPTWAGALIKIGGSLIFIFLYTKILSYGSNKH